jgi:hypothetical protein
VFKGTNHGKGRIGERTLAQLLRARFTSYEVCEKGTVDHSQDVWMHLPGGRMLAFESKHKLHVTKLDIDKFYRDIDAMPSCVGAMFVSLVSPNIPGKSSFCVEVYKSVPVMFIGFESLEECERYFPSYASVLVSLSSHCSILRAENRFNSTTRLAAVIADLVPLVERVRQVRTDSASVCGGLRSHSGQDSRPSNASSSSCS